MIGISSRAQPIAARRHIHRMVLMIAGIWAVLGNAPEQGITRLAARTTPFSRPAIGRRVRTSLVWLLAAIVIPVVLGSQNETFAQAGWPSRPLTIIVPYSAGTTPDIMARQLADQLSARVGQPVIVENRAGAGGLIGTEYAATTQPDGYSLFLGSMDTQAIIGHLYRNKTVDPVKAFVGISLVGQVDNVVSASPMLGISTMKSLIDAGKKGRSFTYATPGIGSNPHLLGELIKLRTGIDLVHVPYRQASTGYTDAMAGSVDLVISGLPPVASLFAEKKLIPLVTTAARRLPSLPDTPTMVELGFDGFISVTWFALLAPANTPAEIVAGLSRHVQEITKIEPYKARLEKMSVAPMSSSPAELDALIQADWARMGDIISRANIVLE